MILRVSVLLAAVFQVVGAAYLSIGTFETNERALQVFIQPAGWAFSIWGLIYTLSFVYAVYQIIPRYDNQLMRATRVPALIGFLSSIAWLYFAGMSDGLVWLTAPVLFLMAFTFTRVVTAADLPDSRQSLFSKHILYPYAAWTGIACWLNVQTLLTDQSIVTSSTVNLVTNSLLFGCIALFTLYYYRKTNYSLWYGGVLIWAGIGIVSTNLSGGLLVFAVLGGLLSATALGLYVKQHWL